MRSMSHIFVASYKTFRLSTSRHAFSSFGCLRSSASPSSSQHFWCKHNKPAGMNFPILHVIGLATDSILVMDPIRQTPHEDSEGSAWTDADEAWGCALEKRTQQGQRAGWFREMGEAAETARQGCGGIWEDWYAFYWSRSMRLLQ